MRRDEPTHQVGFFIGPRSEPASPMPMATASRATSRELCSVSERSRCSKCELLRARAAIHERSGGLAKRLHDERSRRLKSGTAMIASVASRHIRRTSFTAPFQSGVAASRSSDNAPASPPNRFDGEILRKNPDREQREHTHGDQAPFALAALSPTLYVRVALSPAAVPTARGAPHLFDACDCPAKLQIPNKLRPWNDKSRAAQNREIFTVLRSQFTEP